MTRLELRTTLSLASIFVVRMLGLFMILPVFSLYAPHYHGYNAALLGVALGCYGLTQGLLQMPFGILSDYYGRKRVIAGGLSLFALGSLYAALTHSMLGLVIARGLQGAGAIGSTTLALASDLTSVNNRNKAMAVIGISIGLAFSLAMVIGPLVAAHYQLAGIFWLSAALSLLGLVLLYGVIPPEPAHTLSQLGLSQRLKRCLVGPLLLLDASIFILHAILTASFIAIPYVLQQWPPVQHHAWYMYLPVLFGSAILMGPIVSRVDKHPALRCQVIQAAIALLTVSLAALGLQHTHLLATGLSLLGFFTAFNVLEACLPALVSQMAPADCKGTALGIYSTAQFLGIFVGGAAGGLIYGQYSLAGIFSFCVIIAAVWYCLLISSRSSLWQEV